MSYREVAKHLPERIHGFNEIVNPDTNVPYEFKTVQRDVKFLEAEWRKEALATLEDHKAQMIAELDEVKRAAWDDKKYFYVLKALEQKAEVLGLNQLPEINSVTNNNLQINFDIEQVPTDELRRMAQVLDAATNGGAPPAHDPRIIEAG